MHMHQRVTSAGGVQVEAVYKAGNPYSAEAVYMAGNPCSAEAVYKAGNPYSAEESYSAEDSWVYFISDAPHLLKQPAIVGPTLMLRGNII